MPFGIKKSDGKFQVINKHTGRVLGTHDSAENANKQLAAVHINYYGESGVLDETKGKVFKVDIRKLCSPTWKIKETIQDIEASHISQTHEPITVARMGKGKFFIINGNHRVVEAIIRGEKEIDAVLDEYVPDMEKTGGAYDSMTKDAQPVAQAVTQTNEEQDPYGDGPCPICGEFAKGTFRHIGAPKICKNDHYFGGTCGHPDCANTPVPTVVDELSNAGDIQDEPSWNKTEYDKAIIKQKPIVVIEHNFKELGLIKVGLFKETGKYYFINIANKEKIGDIEFKKVDILVGGKVLRGIESDYKVSIVGNYRGKGFSYTMYDTIIKHNNNNPGMWVSDTKLTPVNLSVWKNLLKKYPHEFLISNGHSSPIWISINDTQNIERYRLQFHVQKIKSNPESIWDEKWNAERIRILLKTN